MTLAELAEEIRARAFGRARYLVGIAGAPGSGKSTLATELAVALGLEAGVLPMDGFHLDNATLKARGLFERKGAPETFDSEGFADLTSRVRGGGRIAVPTFDRAADSVVPGGAVLSDSVRIVLVEGNYLLLDAPEWRRVSDAFDLTIMLEEPEDELEARLVARWLTYGWSPAAARNRARENDLVNARLVHRSSLQPDAAVRTDKSGGVGGRSFTVTWSSDAAEKASQHGASGGVARKAGIQ